MEKWNRTNHVTADDLARDAKRRAQCSSCLVGNVVQQTIKRAGTRGALSGGGGVWVGCAVVRLQLRTLRWAQEAASGCPSRPGAEPLSRAYPLVGSERAQFPSAPPLPRPLGLPLVV
ncbi:Phosphatidylserine Synthase 1 [Manis pentadactyla]|nr:Phosphatidylserine Synthase 1 [Manis pentadactyla]